MIGVGAFSGWGSYLFVLEAGWQPGAFGDSMEIWRVPAKLSPPGENTACKACYKQVKGQCSRRGSCMRDWASLPSPGAKPLAGRQGRGRDGQGGLELVEGASPDPLLKPSSCLPSSLLCILPISESSGRGRRRRPPPEENTKAFCSAALSATIIDRSSAPASWRLAPAPSPAPMAPTTVSGR